MSVAGFDPGPPRLARSMWKRFLAAMVTVFFLTAAGSATAVLLEVDDVVDIIRESGGGLGDVEGVLDPVPAGKPQTILVLGSDRRYADIEDGREARSDTMILVRLDPSQQATAVMNIPRDLKVRYRRPDGSFETDKINGAFERGGPKASVRKVKEVMQAPDGRPFPIHHVVSINFGAFRRLVNRLGCFYIDVDRRYFNDNQPPYRDVANYATIDVKPGYQKLCGQDSLDFVRYRHLDTDIVRGARQQHYLGQAKDQIDLDEIVDDRDELLRIFFRYTDTDIRSSAAVLRLLRLALDSSELPTRRVRFRGNIGPSYVTISDEALVATRDEFLDTPPPAGPEDDGVAREPAKRGTASSPAAGSGAPDLEPVPPTVEDLAVRAAVRTSFPVQVPRLMRMGTVLEDGYTGESVLRRYTLPDQDGATHEAYRLTLSAPGVGEYYGVQGTDWLDAPIARDPDEVRTVEGRRLLIFRDGRKMRMVAWKTDRGLYWVSNTLLRSLTNRQMVAIARSLTQVGGAG